MALYGSVVEYGLHCLLHLVDPVDGRPPSARDLADYQELPPAYVAKIFTQLQKAGLVSSEEGVRGGYLLARPADRITVLDVVDALEGEKPLFRCREIRRNCVLFADEPPKWATNGLCSIHAVMRSAEQQMRLVLAGTTLTDLMSSVGGKVPSAFLTAHEDWFRDRNRQRRAVRGKTKAENKKKNENKR